MVNLLKRGIAIECPFLVVNCFDKVLDFYEKYFDLQVVKKQTNDNRGLVYELYFKYHSSSSLRTPLVILRSDPNAESTFSHCAGLYHFAILLPDRRSLASTYLRLKDLGVKFDGFADHLVSESLYLRDPENNGIEIYCDRPSQEWPRDDAGRIIMDTKPLDLDSLLSEIYGEGSRNAEVFPTGGKIGHIHLRVTNLEKSIKFYHEKLGLDLTSDWSSMGAAFLSAGGYHHHVGINTWHSLGGEVHKDGEAGLVNFTITTSNITSFNTIKSNILHESTPRKQKKEGTKHNQFLVHDPDGIQIVIRAASGHIT